MRCKGITKNNLECQRNAYGNTSYCWQHKKNIFNKLTMGLAEIMGVKRRFLLWAIIFIIIFFLIGVYVTHSINKKLDELSFEPDIEIEISPYVYEATFGEYFPLIVTNTGDYTFRNIIIGISSCEMLDEGYYEIYELPLLPSHSERTIPFGNIETIEAFKEKDCYPFTRSDIEDYPSIHFNPFTLKQEISDTSVLCGVCYFNATIRAEYLKNNKTEIFEKKMRSYFSFPTEVTISVSPK